MGFLAAVPALLAGAASAGAASSVAAGMTTASMVAGAAGSLFSGFGQRAASNYQATVATNNAKQLQAEANNSLQAGQVEESTKRLQGGEVAASQMAAQGANNVDVGVGSTVALRDSTKAFSDFDARTVRYNAMLRAYGQNVEASNQLAQAKMDRAQGRMALASSFLGAASSVTGGLGKLGSMSMTNKLLGVGTGGGGLTSAQQAFIAGGVP